MKNIRNTTLKLMFVILIICLATSCSPYGPISIPASTPIRIEYKTDPMGWLAQMVADENPRERLGDGEIIRLNELAEYLSYVDLFFASSKLEKTDMMLPLYFYYQAAFSYDKGTDLNTINPGLLYPPDGIQNGAYSSRLCLSADKAALFIWGLLEADIPDRMQEYGGKDEDYVFCTDGIYYVSQGDLVYPALHLRAYQPLGDGIFYLSFDGDDSAMPGDPEKLKGNMKDYCRMLVKRSSSEWGFTILAKLKEGDKTLLPEDFPLPLYAV